MGVLGIDVGKSGLYACLLRAAPTGQAGVKPARYMSANTAEYNALIVPFQAELAEAGIQVTRASVFSYAGNDSSAFNVATRNFYASARCRAASWQRVTGRYS